MKLAYFDCFAGVAGDMLLGSLLDAGLEQAELDQQLQGLNLPGWRLSVEKVVKQGLSATALSVQVEGEQHPRHLSDISAILDNSALAAADKAQALRVFQRLAEAEAKVHGSSPEEVHFHEVGAVDAIIDIVGVVCGLRLLGVRVVQASPLPLGRGFVRAAHGVLPLPAPAVVELLQGVPITGTSAPGETVTPTGAALLATLAERFGPLPAMRLLASGHGAGRREADYPNVVRLLLGETDEMPSVETLVVLETNIDDMNPQLYEHVLARLFEAGALDVWLTPVYMKKNRPGQVLAALGRTAQENALSQIIFTETTTLGLRRRLVERRSLGRQMLQVTTRYGVAQVKAAILDGQVLRLIPEYDDCRRLAAATGAPLREVLLEVEQAARDQLKSGAL